MSFEKPPLNEDLSAPGAIPRAWAIWLTNLWVRVETGSGQTANRPTKNLFVGKRWYDETLNKPIYLRSVNPTVWKDAMGTSV